MLPYVLTFLLSLLIMHLMNVGKQTSYAKMLTGGMFVLLPLALLGGFRDEKIGTDLQFYAVPIWEYTVGGVNKASDMEWYGIEKSYLLLNFVCAQVSSKLEFFLTVLSFLTLVPIYLTAIKVRRYASPLFLMFMYIFTMYNATYNTMRQSIAMSVTLLAFVYLFFDKKKIAYILYGLSLLLHGSAIIGLLVLGVYYVMTNFHLTRKQISAIAVVVTLCFVVGVIYSQQLIMFAIGSGLIDAKYEAYTAAGGGGLFEARLNKSNLLYDTIVFSLLYSTYSKNKQNKKLYALAIIALMSLLFEFTGLISMYLPRIALYPRMISLFSLPYIFKQIEFKSIRGKLNYKTPVLLFVVLFWVYTYVISQAGETCPYTSKILGIN